MKACMPFTWPLRREAYPSHCMPRWYWWRIWRWNVPNIIAGWRNRPGRILDIGYIMICGQCMCKVKSSMRKRFRNLYALWVDHIGIKIVTDRNYRRGSTIAKTSMIVTSKEPPVENQRIHMPMDQCHQPPICENCPYITRQHKQHLQLPRQPATAHSSWGAQHHLLSCTCEQCSPLQPGIFWGLLPLQHPTRVNPLTCRDQAGGQT